MFTIPSNKEIEELRARVKDLSDMVQRLNEALGGALHRIEQLEDKKVLSHFSKR